MERRKGRVRYLEYLSPHVCDGLLSPLYERISELDATKAQHEAGRLRGYTYKCDLDALNDFITIYGAEWV